MLSWSALKTIFVDTEPGGAEVLLKTISVDTEPGGAEAPLETWINSKLKCIENDICGH